MPVAASSRPIERAVETSWSDVDAAPARARLDDLRGQLERVALEQPEVATLQAARGRQHDDARLAAVRRGAEVQQVLDQLEQDARDPRRHRGRVQRRPARRRPARRPERALLGPCRSPRRARRPTSSARAVRPPPSCGRRSTRTTASGRQHELTLELVFARYLELDRNAGIDATIDSLPTVLAIHRELVDDDLPHAKQAGSRRPGATWATASARCSCRSRRTATSSAVASAPSRRRCARSSSARARRSTSSRVPCRTATWPSSGGRCASTQRPRRPGVPGSTGGGSSDPAEVERRLPPPAARPGHLEERSKVGDAWRRRVLDAREHYQFRAIETRADGTQIVHEGVAGKSGGEGQELIAFVLGAALRFRLGDGTDRVPTYAPIVLDEGFVKADAEYTGRALSALRSLGLPARRGSAARQGRRVRAARRERRLHLERPGPARALAHLARSRSARRWRSSATASTRPCSSRPGRGRAEQARPGLTRGESVHESSPARVTDDDTWTSAL